MAHSHNDSNLIFKSVVVVTGPRDSFARVIAITRAILCIFLCAMVAALQYGSFNKVFSLRYAGMYAILLKRHGFLVFFFLCIGVLCSCLHTSLLRGSSK